MKKTYIAPETQIHQTIAQGMMAVSLKDESADMSEVLVKENNDWNMWSEDEAE